MHEAGKHKQTTDKTSDRQVNRQKDKHEKNEKKIVTAKKHLQKADVDERQTK